jgi:PEP-CTERM motif
VSSINRNNNNLNYPMKKSAFITALVASFAGVVSSSAQSLAITGVVSQTVGTTSAVVGSGTADNTTTFATGTVGVFNMTGGRFMKVTASNPTGSLTPGGDSLMVARTTNSQGLTDDGTLSVYVRPGAETTWTLDLNFSFFSDAALTIAAPTGLQLTSLDIDYAQRYYVSNSSFTHNVTSVGTNLTSAPAVAGYTGFTAVPDAAFNNPNAAVASWGHGSSFDVRVGHNNIALFMLEFRQPSSIVGLVPEPSSALLALSGVAALGLKRRRQRNA